MFPNPPQVLVGVFVLSKPTENGYGNALTEWGVRLCVVLPIFTSLPTRASDSIDA